MLYAYLISHVAHCLASIVPPPAEGKLVPQTPKGGRVQKVLKIDRYKDRRVLRFDGPCGPEGCGIAAFAAMHFINRPPWVVDAF